MQTGKSSIKSIFDGSHIFNIPIYQRAYSWVANKQVKEFLYDIKGQQPNRKYFLGAYLFHLNGSYDDFQIVDVIDGQQRITTFTIFMNSLIEILMSKKSSKVTSRSKRIFIKDGDIFKIKLSNEDNSFFHQYILENSKIDKSFIVTPSQRLLVEAKDFIIKELSNMSLDKLELLYDIAINSEVLVYVVEEVESATQIFELLNDRGKKLTDLESIKSFLMYNVGVVSQYPKQVIEDIQQEFSEIYRMIEKNELNDDDVLRYHTIAFEMENEVGAKEHIKRKINDLINSGMYDEAKKSIINYSRDLKRSFSVFSSIYNNDERIPELDELYMIGRVAPFYPFLMAAKLKSNDEFILLIKALIKFNFRAILGNLRSNAGESYIFTAHKNNENLVQKIESIYKYNWWNINLRAKDALEYDNHYEWLNKNILKYILFKYENHLRKTKGFPLLDFDDYFNIDNREKLSIEHITAQKAKGVKLDSLFNEKFMNNIGNLVIDTVASNSSKGNENTKLKIKSYNNAPIISQNVIDNYNCDWSSIDSITDFIISRNRVIKEFLYAEFEII